MLAQSKKMEKRKRNRKHELNNYANHGRGGFHRAHNFGKVGQNHPTTKKGGKFAVERSTKEKRSNVKKKDATFSDPQRQRWLRCCST